MPPINQSASSAAPESPRRGRFLPDLSLTPSTGSRLRLSNFKGRKSIVLLLLDESGSPLLDDLEQQRAVLEQADTQVIAVWRGDSPPADRWPSILVAAPASHIPSGLARTEPGSLAVHVADRWGEVFHSTHNAPGAQLPAIEEIMGWVEFVDYQCPECFPVEWHGGDP